MPVRSIFHEEFRRRGPAACDGRFGCVQAPQAGADGVASGYQLLRHDLGVFLDAYCGSSAAGEDALLTVGKRVFPTKRKLDELKKNLL